MRGRAVALRRRIDLAGIGLGVGDRLRHGLGRKLGCDHQRVRNARQHRDLLELSGIEIEPRIEVLVDDQRRRRRRQERIAVRLRLVDELGADIAGGARAVLDDDRVPPLAREPLGHDAWHDVGRAAGRERHDDLDRARRIILRAGRRRRRERSDQRCYREEASSKPPSSLRGYLSKSSCFTFLSARCIAPVALEIGQSTEILAAVTTGPHCCSLTLIISRICSGVLPSGSASNDWMRARSSGVLNPCPMASEILRAISLGVLGGAATAIQVSA